LLRLLHEGATRADALETSMTFRAKRRVDNACADARAARPYRHDVDFALQPKQLI